MIYTAEKVHITYFVQNWLVKTANFYVETVAQICCYCLESAATVTIQGTASF